MPACTSDADCGEMHRCEPSGECSIATCQDDGYVCPRLSECATGSDLPTDSHGCIHDACSTDADCPDAHCVDGRCYALPGQCYAQGCA
jgi:hypothetical protein